MEKIDIVLASGSPRRKELLEREGVEFTVRVSEVDEFLEPDLLRRPEEAAKKLAERKARAVLEEMLNEAYVERLWWSVPTPWWLSTAPPWQARGRSGRSPYPRRAFGRAHQVITGVSVWWRALRPTKRTFPLRFGLSPKRAMCSSRNLTRSSINRYIATGEPMDKAGAYGVQGKGGEMLVERVAGDFERGWPAREASHCGIPELLRGGEIAMTLAFRFCDEDGAGA